MISFTYALQLSSNILVFVLLSNPYRSVLCLFSHFVLQVLLPISCHGLHSFPYHSLINTYCSLVSTVSLPFESILPSSQRRLCSLSRAVISEIKEVRPNTRSIVRLRRLGQFSLMRSRNPSSHGQGLFPSSMKPGTPGPKRWTSVRTSFCSLFLPSSQMPYTRK
ncbi:hypothetical protein KCU74_g32, partial [Aureobasidium melanogenum]